MDDNWLAHVAARAVPIGSLVIVDGLSQLNGQLNGLAGQVLLFKISAPEASWVVDLSGAAPRVEQGGSDQAAAVFGIADEDLAALAGGKAEVRDLYQRGKLRVDGDVRLAHGLSVFSKLI